MQGNDAPSRPGIRKYLTRRVRLWAGCIIGATLGVWVAMYCLDRYVLSGQGMGYSVFE